MTMTFVSIEEEINRIATLFDERIPVEKIDQVLDYSTNHGEYGLALATLCDFIIDGDVAITKAEFQSFKTLATEMKLSLHDGVVKYLGDLVGAEPT